MSDVTLEAIERLLDLKLDEKFDIKLAPLQRILDEHTLVLDQIVKQTKDWNAEMAVMRNRMERYEKFLKQLALKLNLDIEPLLH
jgi:hypothetical protein